jgi:intermediate peptidase
VLHGSLSNHFHTFYVQVETLNTDLKLYTSLKNSLASSQIDDIDARVGKMLVDEFEDSGVHLKDEQKREFIELSADVFDAGAQFVRLVNEPSRMADSGRVGESGLQPSIIPRPFQSFHIRI